LQEVPVIELKSLDEAQCRALAIADNQLALNAAWDGDLLRAELQAALLPQSLPDDPLVVGVDVSGGGAAWNVIAFRRSNDARSIPRIRIPGEHTRDRSVLMGKLAEILNDKRPGRKVAAMFIDMAFGSPIYERLRALGFKNVHETNFGLTNTPDRAKANMRAYMWNSMKDWLLHSNQLVLESKGRHAKARASLARRWR